MYVIEVSIETVSITKIVARKQYWEGVLHLDWENDRSISRLVT